MSTTSELARRQNLARKEDERLQASREEQKLEVSDNMLSEHGSEQFVKSIQ